MAAKLKVIIMKENHMIWYKVVKGLNVKDDKLAESGRLLARFELDKEENKIIK
jgi:hypothetical protein